MCPLRAARSRGNPNLVENSLSLAFIADQISIEVTPPLTTADPYPSTLIARNLIQAKHSIMQASLIIMFIPILTATLGAAAAVPDFDFIPGWDWLLGEPTVLDPVEESLEGQSLEQEYPYNLDSAPAELDPSMFEATPPDPTFIDPVLPDPTILDPNSVDPALLDPNDPESSEISGERPNCGNGKFGPNVPLCCNGLRSPGGGVASGCQYHDPGKKVCKNRDNVVCCQNMIEGFGFMCWKYY